MAGTSITGRGAQISISNRFETLQRDLDEEYVQEHIDRKTKVYIDTPKNILSVNTSPDIPFKYSINPYQGCEHGCVYCYARNSHNYWGFGAGLDFESNIVVKKNAPELLEKKFLSRSWKPDTIMLSGNTDCYQPLERKYKITRQLLNVMANYQNPVGVITKNSLILRDLDILGKMAINKLVRVIISVTTLNEEIRRKLEPRSATPIKKLQTINKLHKAGISTGVFIGPIIPGINNQEISSILEETSKAGASFANYSIIRLNGDIGKVFKNWLEINFPDRVNKVWNQICSLHGGKVHDSIFGRRMRGQGPIAESVHQLFHVARKKYFRNNSITELNKNSFRISGNYNLFD